MLELEQDRFRCPLLIEQSQTWAAQDAAFWDAVVHFPQSDYFETFHNNYIVFQYNAKNTLNLKKKTQKIVQIQKIQIISK